MNPAVHPPPLDSAIIPAAAGARPSQVLITGATGFVGRALVARLLQDGAALIVLSRDVSRARARFGEAVTVVDRLDALPADTRIDAVVNLAGARVLGPPWTAARRKVLLDSRVQVTAAVIALMQRLERKPAVLVGASAVGYYGDGGDAAHPPRTEGSPPRPGQFASDLCVAVEREALRAQALGVRVVPLRFGVVMGRGDGAFPMLALSARMGLGAVLGSGRQPAPWIHLEDVVGLIRFALAQPALSGPVNATAPETPTQAGFTRALAACYRRRVYLRVPAPLLRLAGGEMAGLLLDGENVVPQAASAAGYVFRFPTVELALRDLTAR